MKIINKLWERKWILRALIPSIYFNFRKLPFKQACRLPILLYKPEFINISGKIIINSEVRFGLIKLGLNAVSLNPNTGIRIENYGKIIFNGTTRIGNHSVLTVGKNGIIEFGKEFRATTGLQLICYKSVNFRDKVIIGWNVMMSDMDFHYLTNHETGETTQGYGSISVGENVWIANGCKLYKNVTIPDYCVVGADTILHGPVLCPPYSTITTQYKKVISTKGYYLDWDNNLVNPG
ncbi:MAG: hypothetical protein HDS87_02420 [Bacteroidales bacterium]|nr:hypothetical protein [Bacteroidales bacterium]